MRIEPTVARMVWFIALAGDVLFSPNNDDPLAAIVARVNDDGTVNLAVFDRRGLSQARHNVVLVQDGADMRPGESYCCWMPFQKGQAGKTDTLEPRIAAVEELLVKLDKEVAGMQQAAKLPLPSERGPGVAEAGASAAVDTAANSAQPG